MSGDDELVARKIAVAGIHQELPVEADSHGT
jgi:hypothetical protein